MENNSGVLDSSRQIITATNRLDKRCKRLQLQIRCAIKRGDIYGGIYKQKHIHADELLDGVSTNRLTVGRVTMAPLGLWDDMLFPTGWERGMLLRRGGGNTSATYELHKPVVICCPLYKGHCTPGSACFQTGHSGLNSAISTFRVQLSGKTAKTS